MIHTRTERSARAGTAVGTACLVPFAIGLVFLGLVGATSALAAPQARFTPSRSSGVAPLAVHFDATPTTDSRPDVDPFHDLLFTWSFGDPDRELWRFSGRSKNSARGGLAAHVFDRPGTYEVVLTVGDAAGAASTVTHTITVHDPDQTYAGANTVCFSNTSSFSGCPSGALQVTTANFSTALNEHAGPGKRLLLRRGDSFSATARIKAYAGPTTVGAFGSGAKPVVRNTRNGPMIEPYPLSDWRVMDIEAVGSGNGGDDRMFRAEKEGSSFLLLYRLDVHGWSGNAIFFHNLTIEHYDAKTLHNNIFIVDSDVHDNVQNMIFLSGRQLAVMGTRAGNGQHHNIRCPYSERSVFQHNYVHDAGTDRYQLMKLHAGDFTPSGGVGRSLIQGRYSEYLIVADSVFYGQSWMVTIGPQSESKPEYDERVKNVIVERNVFRSDRSTRIGVNVHSMKTTLRNNIFDMSYEGTSSGRGGIHVSNFAQVQERIHGTRVYNNTCITKLSGQSCVTIGGDIVDSVVRNNLMVGSGDAFSSASGGETVMSNNIGTTSNPFVASSPHLPTEFALRSDAPASGGGYDRGTTMLDYFENPRPLANVGSPSEMDVGAVQGIPPDDAPAAPYLLPQPAPQTSP